MTPSNPKKSCEEKFILDACCSGRMMWFNKTHPNAIYIDIRKEEKGLCKERPEFCVEPDLQMDFRDLKFPDGTFKLIAWDPPHLLSLGKNSIMRKKFGCLDYQTWDSDLRKGFLELWRCLEDYGVLIFKWNVQEIPINKVLRLFPVRPLFGHTTGSKSQTRWMTFMKIPDHSTYKKGKEDGTQE